MDKTHTFPTMPIVGIGASAGGLEAFQELLRFLPADTGMAYVCVQHMDPTHKSLLASLLGRATPMVVREVTEDLRLEANQMYVIPPNTDLFLEEGILKRAPRPETPGPHLPIDRFFSSLAANEATLAIGIILSGTASDGTRGLQAIKRQGGMTFAQEAASAKYPGMPQSAIATGNVDFIGSPAEIARELARISQHPYARPVDMGARSEQSPPVPPPRVQAEGEQDFQSLLRILRQHTDVDFTAYKPTTLKRRMLRRMGLLPLESTGDYLTYVQQHPTEVDALYQDILIGVTDFFRHPSTYQTLIRLVLPRLITSAPSREPIRVWVPGCSTGEEVYSLAICLLEFFTERSLAPHLQLFGTDLNANAIEHARTGIYTPDAVKNLSPERVQRFFHTINGNHQVTRPLRDLCVFAHHNLLKDPPFSRIDLLSCQNVLIYLEPGTQKKLIQIFHYALKPQGVLLLGPSETIGTASDLFAPLEERKQLYTKKVTSARLPFIGPISSVALDQPEEDHPMRYEEGAPEGEIQKEVDRLLLARYAPPSVVIDAQMEILSVRGHTSPYLEPAPGKVSFNLFKMAREGLGLELRTALAKAKKSGRPVHKAGIPLQNQGIFRDVSIEIIPLQASATERSFLILFAETSLPALSTLTHDEEQPGRARRGAKDRRIQQLEDDLASRSDDMRAIIEEMEAANEELQSANEEILSSNEELQSLNEELETSKEETQSTNEELVITNQELQQRNMQLQAARTYAEAIVETIREPLLVLDRAMRVQSANRAFYTFFQTTPEETEQQLFFQLGNRQWNSPPLRTLLEEILPQKHSLMDYEVEHLFAGIGTKTILLNARRIEDTGFVLLALEDITERKRLMQEQQNLLEQREDFLGIASHELKTPITSIKSYTQMLHRRFLKTGDEQAATFLGRMDEQLNRLIRLIGELLDLTKLEAGELPWHEKEFDLLALVQETVETLEHIMTHQQIRITGSVDAPVVGDRERLSQVLTNLLSNALKYSPEADTVLVHLHQDEAGATIGVQDFGIGIDISKQAHLFERFFRVSDTEHLTFPGLGLGLYISAQIVQRQGGMIWVESNIGEGATFFFTIPHQKKAPDAENYTDR